jgi:hypothetical protein
MLCYDDGVMAEAEADPDAQSLALRGMAAAEALLLWARCLAAADPSERDLEAQFVRLLETTRKGAEQLRQGRRNEAPPP